jgi:hypothetical protein
LALILALADYLDRKQSRLGRFLGGYVPPLLVTGAVLGLIVLERDLGTPLLIGCVAMGMIFLAGARPVHLAVTVLGALPLLYMAVFHVAYRRERFFSLSWIPGKMRRGAATSWFSLSWRWGPADFGEKGPANPLLKCITCRNPKPTSSFPSSERNSVL